MGDGMVAGMEATQISFSNQNKAEPMAPEMMNRAGSGTVVRNRSAIVAGLGFCQRLKTLLPLTPFKIRQGSWNQDNGTIALLGQFS